MYSTGKKEGKTIRDVYDFVTWMYAGTAGWRVDSHKKSIRVAYGTFKTLTYVAYLYHLTTIIIGVAFYYDDLQMFCFCLTYVIIAIVGLSKIMLLERHVPALKKLEHRLENDLYLPWMGKTEQERLVKERNAHILVELIKLIFILSMLGVVVTIFCPLFPNSKQVFVVPTPFDHLSDTPLFLPLYMFQSFCLITFITAFICYDLMFIGIIIRLCDQMEIIRLHMREIDVTMPDDGIPKESDSDSANLLTNSRKYSYTRNDDGRQQPVWFLRQRHERLIKNCIAHHQAVFREIKLIGSIYSYTTFCYIFCGPFLMGLLAYVILSGTAANNILMQQACYGVPAGIFLFMQCYFGTMLSIKCEDVRFALYDCPWYKMDIKTRKLIVTALITMEKTGKLRAGNFVDVALTSFLWSLKVSYNIVTFLKNTS